MRTLLFGVGIALSALTLANAASAKALTTGADAEASYT